MLGSLCICMAIRCCCFSLTDEMTARTPPRFQGSVAFQYYTSCMCRVQCEVHMSPLLRKPPAGGRGGGWGGVGGWREQNDTSRKAAFSQVHEFGKGSDGCMGSEPSFASHAGQLYPAQLLLQHLQVLQVSQDEQISPLLRHRCKE